MRRQFLFVSLLAAVIAMVAALAIGCGSTSTPGGALTSSPSTATFRSSPTPTSTSDGSPSSLTWVAQRSGVKKSLSAVAFTDRSHGCAVGSSGTILTTTNGGRTWAVCNPAGPNTPNVSDFSEFAAVAFGDASHGWVVGWANPADTATALDGTILMTSDGGQTWAIQYQSSSFMHLSGVHFVNASDGWVVGDHGTILATTNGGQTWTAQNSGTHYNLDTVTFTDQSHGWVVGRSNEGGKSTLIATMDGGQTWTAQNPPASTIFFGPVDFVDQSHGWAAGIGKSGWSILATANGGRTWTVEKLPGSTIMGLLGISFVDQSHGWAVGRGYRKNSNGAYSYYGIILATTNGGQTWTAMNLGTKDWFTGVDFTDAGRGWVVGANGTILTTTDARMP